MSSQHGVRVASVSYQSLDKWLGEIGFTGLMLYSAARLVWPLYFYESPAWVGYVFYALAALGGLRMLLCRTLYRVSRPMLATGLLLGLMVLSVVAQLAITSEVMDVEGRSSHEYLWKATGMNFLWLLCGVGAFSSSLKQSSSSALGVIFLLLFLVFRNLGAGMFTVDYSRLRQLDVGAVTHLSFDDYVALLACFSLAVAGRARPVVYLGLLPVFFVLGSRTTFFIFGVVGWYYTAKHAKKRWLLVAALSVSFILAWLKLLGPLAETQVSVGRMFLEGGAMADQSVAARLQLLLIGLTILPAQAWFGGLVTLVERTGSLGGGIHNVLNVWQFYGVIPFLLVCYLLFKYFKKFYAGVVNIGRDRSEMFLAVAILYVSICSALSRGATFSLLWFVLGFAMMADSLSLRGRVSATLSSGQAPVASANYET